jgi:hypothetical protein
MTILEKNVINIMVIMVKRVALMGQKRFTESGNGIKLEAQ